MAMTTANDALSPAVRYAKLVQAARSGVKFPPALIRGILAESGHSSEELLLDALGCQSAPGPQPGDVCECGGTLIVTNTKRHGQFRHQYLSCNGCHRAAGKRAIPEGAIRHRKTTLPS